MATTTVCDKCGEKTKFCIDILINRVPSPAGTTDDIVQRVELCGPCALKLMETAMEFHTYDDRKMILRNFGYTVWRSPDHA